MSRCEITAVKMSPKKILHLGLGLVLQCLPEWIYFCKEEKKKGSRTATFFKRKKWMQVQIVTSATVSCSDIPRKPVKCLGSATMSNCCVSCCNQEAVGVQSCLLRPFVLPLLASLYEDKLPETRRSGCKVVWVDYFCKICCKGQTVHPSMYEIYLQSDGNCLLRKLLTW